MKSNLFAKKGAKTIKHKLFESKQHIFRVSFISQKITCYETFFPTNSSWHFWDQNLDSTSNEGFCEYVTIAWCKAISEGLSFFSRIKWNWLSLLFFCFKQGNGILLFLFIWLFNSFIPFDFILFCLWFLFFFWILRIYCNRNKLLIPSRTADIPKTFCNIQNGTNLT